MNKQRKKQATKNKSHPNRNAVNESEPVVAGAECDKILPHQVRSQVRALVAEILSVVFITPVNPKEEWDQYLIIQNLLKKIQLLEAPLKENLRLNKFKRLDKINEFYKWSHDHGIKYDGVIIKEFPGYELGLAATKTIKRNDLLFTIPHKLIMSEECIERGGKLFKLSNLRLAFLLMTEALNPHSFWKPYIDLLPDSYNTVLYYDTEDMAQLRGSNCLSAALKQCRLIARCYATIYHWPNSDLPFDVFKEYFHYDLYRLLSPKTYYIGYSCTSGEFVSMAFNLVDELLVKEKAKEVVEPKLLQLIPSKSPPTSTTPSPPLPLNKEEEEDFSLFLLFVCLCPLKRESFVVLLCGC
uniref:protein-histidine N-methyltransferase n=1 Tax=Glossina brevipalpis TaxID=37001 RepID=A0A1A9W6C4_9MUSC